MISSHEHTTNEGDTAPGEKVHSDAIEREKAAYKETLERLRGLKGTIEGMQSLVQKDRSKLQSDFDTWYHQVCLEESRVRSSVGTVREKKARHVPSSTSSNEQVLRSTSQSSSHVETETPCKPEVAKQQATEAPKEFQLPPGIKLTGNAEADEDIIAFYKAKEVLLSKVKR